MGRERRKGLVEPVAAALRDQDGGYSCRHSAFTLSADTALKPTACREVLDRLAAELAAFALGETAPDAEALVVREGVVEAFRTHFAAFADALGFTG